MRVAFSIARQIPSAHFRNAEIISASPSWLPHYHSSVRCAFLISSFLVLAQSAFAQQTREVWQTAKLYPKITCYADPAQSYALYLPGTYRDGQPSPVIFIFDPAARGSLPLKIAREAAEKFGYILIASNNSRNGPSAPQAEAANAMWNDAHQRLSLDPRRTYFAGFSGGSRLAVSFTAGCKGCAAGVIASGAAFPIGVDPKSVSRFLYFGAVGFQDFNYPEYLELEPVLKESGYTYHLRHFDGGHDWAPSDVWLEALEWFNLQGMKSGTLAKDEKFISHSYSRALSAAASQKNDLERFRLYCQIASDFASLADVSTARRYSDELANSKTVKDLAKHERQQTDDQNRLAGPISAQLEDLKNPDLRAHAAMELHRLFDQLKKKADDAHDPQQVIARRVLTQEIIHAYENGMQMMADRDYANALLLYDAIVANTTAAPGAHFQKLRIYLLIGDRKKALLEARLAIKDGIDDPDTFSDPEFAALRSDPAFKALLDSLHPTKTE